MNREELKVLQEYGKMWKQKQELEKKLDSMKVQVTEIFEKNGITTFNYVGIIWSYIKEKLVPEHTVKEYTARAHVSLRK